MPRRSVEKSTTRSGKIETYDRAVDLEASRLAITRGSSTEDRMTFATSVISNAERMADYIVRRPANKKQA
jgi:hypothetical protein